jgi:formate dehydrogenase major subunit
MFEAALAGSFKGLYCQGEDIVQSDPNTQHVAAALSAMECIVVQDIFLNETAKYAHVFLPGSSFLEKDGTFTNAERRISRVRKVMPPLAGYADWEVTILLSNALGYPMHYTIRRRSWTRSRAHADFAGVSYEKLDARQHAVAVQRRPRRARRPCTWTPSCAARAVHHHQYVPTDEKVNRATR